MEVFLAFLVIIGSIFALIVVATSVRVVRQSTVGVVERLGQYVATQDAGIRLMIPFIDSMRIVDMREQVYNLPSQPVITKENVTMNIDAIIYFQVTDAFRATYEVADLLMAVEKLALTNMRNIIGEMTLDETLASREVINAKLQHVLDDATGKWGIKANRVEVKDIDPPRDIVDSMQKEMRAEREKRAMILTAEGEKQSAILRAEGEREAAIRNAEGQQQALILEAEGHMQASIKRAEGEATAIRSVQTAEAEMVYKMFTSIDAANPSREVLQVKYLEALEKVSQGQSNTLFLPYESVAFLGALAGSVRAVALKGEKENGSHQ
ncbi:MAG TPA: SPFH domain-containing protein [Coleofasciculaceae cyanobacterium]|jgi:regulator of protease activity HflC (stomatin/prohibitin superfamily)